MTAKLQSAEADLRQTVAELTRRIGVLEAQQAVRRLQHQYGYYLDKCLYKEVVDLFADDGDVYFCGGRYKGKEGVRRLYLGRFANRFVKGHNGPLRGFLLDHPQLQDVVTVSDDLRSAQGRFRSLMQAGLHESVKDSFPGTVSYEQWWEGGIYENRYINDDGIWKIQYLQYRPVWHGEYSKGWAKTEPMSAVIPTKTFPEDPVGPDEITGDFALFPNTDVVAFHYLHPATGEAWAPQAER